MTKDHIERNDQAAMGACVRRGNRRRGATAIAALFLLACGPSTSNMGRSSDSGATDGNGSPVSTDASGEPMSDGAAATGAGDATAENSADAGDAAGPASDGGAVFDSTAIDAYGADGGAADTAFDAANDGIGPTDAAPRLVQIMRLVTR